MTDPVDTGRMVLELRRLLAEPGEKRILVTADGRVQRLEPEPPKEPKP